MHSIWRVNVAQMHTYSSAVMECMIAVEIEHMGGVVCLCCSCWGSCCRSWWRALKAVTAPDSVSHRIMLMLNWVDTFICKSRVLQQRMLTVDDLELAASVIADRLADMLPSKQLLLKSLPHLSAMQCAQELQSCQISPAGQGKSTCIPHV